MRLRIENSEGVVFILWLPTSLLKFKFIIKSIKKYGRIDDNEILLPFRNPVFYFYCSVHSLKNVPRSLCYGLCAPGGETLSYRLKKSISIPKLVIMLAS